MDSFAYAPELTWFTRPGHVSPQVSFRSESKATTVPVLDRAVDATTVE